MSLNVVSLIASDGFCFSFPIFLWLQYNGGEKKDGKDQKKKKSAEL